MEILLVTTPPCINAMVVTDYAPKDYSPVKKPVTILLNTVVSMEIWLLFLQIPVPPIMEDVETWLAVNMVEVAIIQTTLNAVLKVSLLSALVLLPTAQVSV